MLKKETRHYIVKKDFIMLKRTAIDKEKQFRLSLQADKCFFWLMLLMLKKFKRKSLVWEP